MTALRPFRLLVVVLALTACGGPSAPTQLTVSDAWARPTPVGSKRAAVYLTAVSPSADRLVKVTSVVAAHAMVHGSTVGSHEAGGHHGAPGSNAMVGSSFDLAPGKTGVMAPGGMHIMLGGLMKPLREGDTFPMTLTFREAGEVRVKVLVALNGPG